MHLMFILKILAVLPFITVSQHSHVQQAKQRIRTEVRSALNLGRYQSSHQKPPPQQHYLHHHHAHGHRNRWSGRRKSIERHHEFTGWSAWSECGGHDCVKRRERFCKLKRKCGFTKHVEERKCMSGCHWEKTWHNAHHMPSIQSQQFPHSSNTPQAIIINAAAAPAAASSVLPATTPPEQPPLQHPLPQYPHYPVRMPVLQEVVEYKPKHEYTDERLAHSDFYSLKARPKYRKERKPVFIQADDYNELASEESEDEQNESTELGQIYPLRLRNQQLRQLKREQKKSLRSQHVPLSHRNLAPDDDGLDGDLFQYEDFDFEQDTFGKMGTENQYSDSYEDNNDYGEYRNSTSVSPSREKATPDALVPKHRRLYSKWSRWTKCSPKCTTRRYKKCRVREQCGREVLREIAYCYTEGSFCQQWLQAQVQKSPPYELRPAVASRRLDNSEVQSNSIVGDFIMNGKGYRGPEYTAQKIRCGIPAQRSGKRHMYNLLKIIGGKAARKGEWPWQVAIFNRFKEAFCGGTLIAPQWVLTAAHCVRKVLYVRIGEHNLDFEDGTELQLRVLKTFKHPNFDKKTVDSDVALLKLPKPINATSWIGFSCLPHPYQPLPRNVDCTVIGWGKRRNRDVAGTSVLHQAEVPIIPMDNCRSVYHDYTITKNMFCAGHRRGRVDTCAGDSGGPLLCRDKTKPNHPWTIFGITSFGDGCAKRNKFGIYAKVPNYVDWVWSVINCNGNCKMHQRGYGN